MARIAVVDDKAMLRESLALALGREDHTVTTFEDPLAALAALRREDFELVIVDLKMPRMDGLSLIRELRGDGIETPAMVMTAYGTVSTAVEAMKLGAFDFVQKPFEVDALAVQVDRALQHGQLRKENEALKTSLDELRPRRVMIGGSDAMTEVRIKCAQVARSDATVLISGESGTGKELVAAAIHEASPRREKPMLCVNCAALSSNLLESELFGHERGAFTGADRLHKGRFELADQGTLLLDEISEMALPLQAKLLRVLQEGEFERVGANHTRRSDVRVIATTNRDLSDWVTRQQFRADLYYRLNVLPIALPSLRERPEDIAELVDFFLERTAKRQGRKRITVDGDALQLLIAYGWPGNVRELENICERAAVLVNEGRLSRRTIEGWIRPPSTVTHTFGELRHGRMMEDMERQLIERTLQQHGGHRERSAKALGIGVRTLGMKLKQWREEAAARQRIQAATAVLT